MSLTTIVAVALNTAGMVSLLVALWRMRQYCRDLERHNQWLRAYLAECQTSVPAADRPIVVVAPLPVTACLPTAARIRELQRN